MIFGGQPQDDWSPGEERVNRRWTHFFLAALLGNSLVLVWTCAAQYNQKRSMWMSLQAEMVSYVFPGSFSLAATSIETSCSVVSNPPWPDDSAVFTFEDLAADMVEFLSMN